MLAALVIDIVSNFLLNQGRQSMHEIEKYLMETMVI